MLAIFKREVRSFFYSPTAYIFIGFFLLLTSVFFVLSNIAYQTADFTINFGSMAIVLVFIVPILTMKLIAEDRKTGTDQLLLTSPTSVAGIVLGKYFAALFVFLVTTIITFIYPIIMSFYGDPPVAPLVGSYIGFLFLGATFISVGVFASSLAENQIISAVISFGMLLFLWLIDGLKSIVTNGFLVKLIDWFSVLSRYEDFYKGILNISPIVYYLSFISVFIFLTIQVIEKRRWSQE